MQFSNDRVKAIRWAPEPLSIPSCGFHQYANEYVKQIKVLGNSLRLPNRGGNLEPDSNASDLFEDGSRPRKHPRILSGAGCTLNNSPILELKGRKMIQSAEKPRLGKPNRRARVMIVDDHELIRTGLRQLVERQSDLSVCGEASDVNQAKQIITETVPDVVLVDLRLGETSGLDLIKWMVDQRPEIRIIVCTMHSEITYGERVLRLGATGFVSKQDSVSAIIAAIRKVLAGGLFFSEELTQQVMRRSSRHSAYAAKSPVAALSDREIEILSLLGQGCTTDMIAQRLFLSRNTIGTYRERLKTKLDLKNCSELVYFAIHWVEDRDTHDDQQDSHRFNTPATRDSYTTPLKTSKPLANKPRKASVLKLK
jgi:DNA-binding NarL/FixJ family response regulator